MHSIRILKLYNLLLIRARGYVTLLHNDRVRMPLAKLLLRLVVGEMMMIILLLRQIIDDPFIITILVLEVQLLLKTCSLLLIEVKLVIFVFMVLV